MDMMRQAKMFVVRYRYLKLGLVILNTIVYTYIWRITIQNRFIILI